MPENICSQLHIAICDDESLDCQRIAALTGQILQDEKLPCEISCYSNGAELLSAVRGGVKFQILLLDVIMDGLDGMELAATLRELGDNTAIIFISVNREMAMRGYEVAAVRYLGKPVQPDRLREALLYCHKTFYEKKEILLLTSNGQRKIPISNIIYAEAAERTIKLFMEGEQEKLIMKFSDLMTLLPESQFTLCHRSYLVNLDYVKYVRRRELELTVGNILPVSKYRLNDLRQRFINYLSD